VILPVNEANREFDLEILNGLARDWNPLQENSRFSRQDNRESASNVKNVSELQQQKQYS
jgi:hypothetical protein